MNGELQKTIDRNTLLLTYIAVVLTIGFVLEVVTAIWK